MPAGSLQRLIVCFDGVLRLSTPNLRALAEGYVSGTREARQLAADFLGRGTRDFGDWSSSAINQQALSWSHLYLFGLESITVVLTAAGFNQIRKVGIGSSNIQALRGLEQQQIGTALDPFILVVEASR